MEAAHLGVAKWKFSYGAFFITETDDNTSCISKAYFFVFLMLFDYFSNSPKAHQKRNSLWDEGY